MIQTIIFWARYQLLHAMYCWPAAITTELCTYPVWLAVNIHNNSPLKNSLCPLNLFASIKHCANLYTHNTFISIWRHPFSRTCQKLNNWSSSNWYNRVDFWYFTKTFAKATLNIYIINLWYGKIKPSSCEGVSINKILKTWKWFLFFVLFLKFDIPPFYEANRWEILIITLHKTLVIKQFFLRKLTLEKYIEYLLNCT